MIVVLETNVETYRIDDADGILTPALLIYPEIVDANIRATLKMAGGEANRWRPHIKTAKIPAILRRYVAHGVKNFKCSTTLELLVACEAGAADVVLAYSVMGANARRARQIAEQFPEIRISVLIETLEQIAPWRGTKIGIFIDVNSGMNRTGVNPDAIPDIVALAKHAGQQFRGVHFYDGHMSGVAAAEREKQAHQGYDRLLTIVRAIEAAGIAVGEVITSGTPAAPYAISYPGFHHRAFVHRISPGTVIYNDTTSLEQLPDFGYQPAAIVLSTVVSRPAPCMITCDAGHKSVSADAGVPTCAVIGHSDWTPNKPSEEHLPIEVSNGAAVQLGEKLYLVPRHVCPTVNNFDEGLMVVNGKIRQVESVAARGHESTATISSFAT